MSLVLAGLVVSDGSRPLRLHVELVIPGGSRFPGMQAELVVPDGFRPLVVPVASRDSSRAGGP